MKLLLLTLCFGAAVAQAQTYGTIEALTGTVQIESAKAAGKFVPARIGMRVVPHDVIVTQAHSTVKIHMIDNNEFHISPESRLTIAQYDDEPAQHRKVVLIDLVYGKIRSALEQKYDGKGNQFQVQTPTAVAGVRGTDFLTVYNQKTKTTDVVTFRGQVAFGARGPNGTIRNPVFVSRGHFSRLIAGRHPTHPKPVPKALFRKMARETRVRRVRIRHETHPRPDAHPKRRH